MSLFMNRSLCFLMTSCQRWSKFVDQWIQLSDWQCHEQLKETRIDVLNKAELTHSTNLFLKDGQIYYSFLVLECWKFFGYSYIINERFRGNGRNVRICQSAKIVMICRVELIDCFIFYWVNLSLWIVRSRQNFLPNKIPLAWRLIVPIAKFEQYLGTNERKQSPVPWNHGMCPGSESDKRYRNSICIFVNSIIKSLPCFGLILRVLSNMWPFSRMIMCSLLLFTDISIILKRSYFP